MLKSLSAVADPVVNRRPCHRGFVTKGSSSGNKQTVWSKMSAYFDRHIYMAYACCFVGMPVAICTAVSLITTVIYLLAMAFLSIL
ncbi:hypothetical protein [Solibaculum mannosilyticum]|uniref:hypothetical protein n=1 Tax=Solibaculum mannosilyticum TaxID=2780922 RepID=UPI0007A81BDA|nr:hypothetical protein BN3661_01898 [Eubacteriaceae bacterium CHKCI005]